MGICNQCSVCTVRMANSGFFCSVLVLLITGASSLASPRIRSVIAESTIPTAGSITWQENVSNYPEQAAENLIVELERQNKTQYFLSSDKIKELSERTTQNAQNVNYTNLCSSVVKKRLPQSVEINGEQFYVLNPDSRPFQFIETEECVRDIEGKPCDLVNSAENSYSTKCQQEYVTRELYLMDKENPGLLRVQSILIESCCSCFVYLD